MFIVEICTRNKYLQRHLIKFLATMSRVNSFSIYLCGRHEESFEKVPVAKRKCSDRKWRVETEKWILHLSKPSPLPSSRIFTSVAPTTREQKNEKFPFFRVELTKGCLGQQHRSITRFHLSWDRSCPL